MSRLTRRQWLGALGAGAAAAHLAPGGASAAPQDAAATKTPPLPLAEFQPRSMLEVPVTRVPKASFPVVDVHTHLSFRAKGVKGVPHGEEIRTLMSATDLLAAMDPKNVRTMVNLTGGVGTGLARAVKEYDQAAPGRFVSFTEPSYDRAAEPGYATWQADELGRAKAVGARGVKVLKALGLYLRERITEGPLVKVDDPRFDPMWEACAALNLPVAIHIADPVAFFLPTDRYNERYEELNAHPDWSFHGRDFPSFQQLMAARDRLFARHPKTTFIALHVGHYSENLAAVGEALDRFPNMAVEIGARIGELGRQPRASRKFFDKYQDRILFGTDAVPRGTQTPQQVFGERLYEIYFRFLETEDEYFDYAPSEIPPQGRWQIYGLGLPEGILRKVYHQNAERLLHL